jgi:hypothetical protein
LIIISVGEGGEGSTERGTAVSAAVDKSTKAECELSSLFITALFKQERVRHLEVPQAG